MVTGWRLSKPSTGAPGPEGQGSQGANPSGPSMLGRVLAGRYRIIDFIARGGMGQVYLAEQLGLGRKVAVKVLDTRHQDAWSSAEEFHRRFEREASLAARLAHPNIVVIHDYGTDGVLFFIVMEYLEGRTLEAEVNERGPLAPMRWTHVTKQACTALAEAHRAGLIHRDLKPSNLLLLHRGRDDDFLKLVDFGLVKRLGPRGDRGPHTRPGSLMGSPAYLSPEQVLDEDVTAATDIYALGAVMFFMATGKPPFQARSEYALIKAHVETTPPRLKDVWPASTAPPQLERIIMRCLSKAPKDRFGSIEELEAALAALEASLFATESATLGVAARVAPGEERTGEISPDAATSSRPPPRAPSATGAVRGPGSDPAGAPRITSSVPPAAFLPDREFLHSVVKRTSRDPSAATLNQSRPPAKSDRLLSTLTVAMLLLTAAGVGSALLWAATRKPESAEAAAARTPPAAPRLPEPAVDPGVLEVTTHPAGATLWMGTRLVGDTPVKLALSVEDAPWKLRVEKEGFVAREVTVDRGTGRIDIALQRLAGSGPVGEPE